MSANHSSCVHICGSCSRSATDDDTFGAVGHQSVDHPWVAYPLGDDGLDQHCRADHDDEPASEVAEIQWVLTSFMIARRRNAHLAWLGGRLGNRRLYLTSLSVYLVASMLCGLS